MPASVSESDWKQFRDVHRILLQRHCRQTLEQLGKLASGNVEDAHERYLEIYSFLVNRDRDLATAFNDFRRSTAFSQLVIMRRTGLLTDNELGRFSEELQAGIRRLDSM